MLRGQTPPQAYAKEVLIQAYHWIQSQPDSVKAQALTADALIALFNRARRSNAPNGNMDMQVAPVSSEKFRSELKDIATELKNFSDPEQAPAEPAPRQLPLDLQRNFAPRPSILDESRESMRESNRDNLRENLREDIREHKQTLSMDARTVEMLHKVKSHLNLSSDSEALRMLVVLGFERLQNLFR